MSAMNDGFYNQAPPGLEPGALITIGGKLAERYTYNSVVNMVGRVVNRHSETGYLVKVNDRRYGGDWIIQAIDCLTTPLTNKNRSHVLDKEY